MPNPFNSVSASRGNRCAMGAHPSFGGLYRLKGAGLKNEPTEPPKSRRNGKKEALNGDQKQGNPTPVGPAGSRSSPRCNKMNLVTQPMLNALRTALPWIMLTCLPVAAIQAQTITNLNPNSATAGGPSFTLTISGIGFNNSYGQPIVQWNQQPLSSTFSSNTQQILAQVPGGLILNPGVATIQVLIANSPSSNGYSLSNVVRFPVNPSTSDSPFTLSVSSVSLQFSLGSQAQKRQVQVSSKRFSPPNCISSDKVTGYCMRITTSRPPLRPPMIPAKDAT